MALLNTNDRKEVSHHVTYTDKETGGLNLSKAERLAAVDAADQWADDNKVSFNNALPVAAKANLSNKQKAKILRLVLRKRWEVDA